jgi:hypothetical protein
MPTVIDSLIVELGLDPTDFNKGQKAAADAFLKTKEAAVDAGNQIEGSGKRSSDSLDRVTKSALSLFAVLLGAKGLTDFAVNVTQADAALGRFADNMGATPQTVAAFEMVAQRFGGSAEATAGTIEKVNKQLYDLRRNGQMLPKEFAQLEARSGVNIDPLHGFTKYMDDAATAANKLAQTDRNGAFFLLQGMGIDSGTANAMIQYGSAFSKYVQDAEKYAPSNTTIKRMQDMQTQWTTLQQSAAQFASTMVGDIEPVMAPLLADFQKWTDLLIKMEPEIDTFATGAAKIATSMGDWRIAIEALVALWAGGKLVGMLGAVRGLLGLGGAEAAGAAAGSGVGGLGIAAAALGWDAYQNTVKQAGAGEDAVVQGINGGAAAKGYTPGAVYDPATGTWGGSGGTSRGWWTADRQAHAYQVLTEQAGLSDAGARGLISRWVNVESPNGPGSSNDIGGGHFGLPQWSHDRAGSLWGNTDYDAQLQGVVTELKGPESVAGNLLRNAKTDAQGAVGASAYERAEGYDPSLHSDNFTGKTLLGMSSIATKANASAAANMLKWAGVPQTNHNVSSSTSSSQVNINGPIVVQTQATDANGIAGSLGAAMKRASMAQAANSGPA